MKRVTLANGNSQEQPSQPSPSESKPHDVRLQKQIPLQAILDMLGPSVQVGLATGSLGMFTGAVFGIARSQPVMIFSALAGTKWFFLGSSFHVSRTIVDDMWGGRDSFSNADRVKSSAIGGGFAGVIGGLMHGPRHVAHWTIMCTVLAASGQAVGNALRPYSWQGAKATFLSSAWNPIKPIGDEDYQKMLDEKLLRVEADIAVVDDNIKAIRDKGQPDGQAESKADSKPGTTR